MRNIVLIGFMGCGKTAVSEELAQKLHYTLLDTDEQIEKEQEKTVSEVFEVFGEAYFRKLEGNLLIRLQNQPGPMVIATGGGMAARPENKELLKALGDVFFLQVKAETVLERLSGDQTRPLLQGDHKKSRVEKLLAERTPFYMETADYVITTDGKRPNQIADEIIKRKMKYENFDY